MVDWLRIIRKIWKRDFACKPYISAQKQGSDLMRVYVGVFCGIDVDGSHKSEVFFSFRI